LRKSPHEGVICGEAVGAENMCSQYLLVGGNALTVMRSLIGKYLETIVLKGKKELSL
jgi:hypothetical protein